MLCRFDHGGGCGSSQLDQADTLVAEVAAITAELRSFGFVSSLPGLKMSFFLRFPVLPFLCLKFDWRLAWPQGDRQKSAVSRAPRGTILGGLRAELFQ